MTVSSVPLTAISLSGNIPENPIVESVVLSLDEDQDYQRIWTLEWYWGLNKGTLPLQSDINSFQMRSDMLESYRNDGWRLMPTTDALQAMKAMLQHNRLTDGTSRKIFTEEFSTSAHGYHLVPVALNVEKQRPTIYIDVGEAHPRAFDYPYSDLPVIQSRAHPFFVMYTLEDFTLGGCRLLKYPWIRPYNSTILQVTRLWRGTPPAEFRYGPDLPLEHWHPRSIQGDADDSSCTHSCPVDGSHIAFPTRSCHRLYALDADHLLRLASSLGKRKRPAEYPADVADAPLCPMQGPGRTRNPYHERSAIAAWIDGIDPLCDDGLRSSPASAIAEADSVLARYAHEPLRQPHEVMRTGRRIPQGSIPPCQERDTSRFTSCNWAEQKYCRYLWGYRDASA